MAQTTFQAYTGMQITLYSAPLADTAFNITYSCIPTGDLGTVELNLSPETRDAIVACALSEVLALPGEHQNLFAANQKKDEYERMKAALAALGVLGQGAAAQFQAPAFTPTNGRFSPYLFQPYFPTGR